MEPALDQIARKWGRRRGMACFATPHSLYRRILGDDDLSCCASSYPLQMTQNW